MKNIITHTSTIIVLAFFLAGAMLNAQNTTTVTVGPEDSGATYRNIKAAITGVQAGLANDDILIVSIAEGVLLEPANQVYGLQKPLKVTIKGAGADKTIIQSPLSAAPTIADNTRMVQYNTPAASGSVISFEDLKFLYWGGYGNNAGGSIINVNNPPTATTPMVLTLAFKNVIFEECVGASLINTWMESTEFVFDNCLFLKCETVIASNQALQGLISKPSGGKLTVKNTSFVSNKIQSIPSETNTRVTLNGGLITVSTPAINAAMANDAREGKANVLLEGNAFINNKVNDAAYDSVFPMIGFKTVTTSDTSIVTLTNNISIGNVRAGKIWDTDLYYNDQKIGINVTGNNIMNRALKRVTTGVDPDFVSSYQALTTNPQMKLNAAFTYTHPDINFEMDGDLPIITADGFGIGKVSYTGDGGAVSVNMNLPDYARIYTFDKKLFVSGLKSGEKLEIYTITGSLFTRSIATGDRFEMEMPKGIYLVKVGPHAQKVLVY